MLKISASLGSDVPFFINGGSQLCFGRGEILEKLNYKYEYGVILLKNPTVSISTAETYKSYSQQFVKEDYIRTDQVDKIRKNLRKKSLNDFNIEDNSIKIKNDLQLVVEKENDSVKQALYLLSNLRDCLTFSMSGSGPTCFGLFKNFETANKVLDDNYKIFKNKGFDSWACKLLDKGIKII